MTNEELAAELDVASGKLYFHTKKLLDAGLIEFAGTRRKGPLTEKLYRQAGVGFAVPVVEDGSAPPLAHYIANAMSLYENTWRERAGVEFMQLGYHIMRPIPAVKARELFQKIKDLSDEIEAITTDLNDGESHSISYCVLFHEVDRSND